tara:strand:+ start:734 stop:2308 length:1575 start_codon:yes stop_codon:yes gene_type:complete
MKQRDNSKQNSKQIIVKVQGELPKGRDVTEVGTLRVGRLLQISQPRNEATKAAYRKKYGSETLPAYEQLQFFVDENDWCDESAFDNRKGIRVTREDGIKAMYRIASNYGGVESRHGANSEVVMEKVLEYLSEPDMMEQPWLIIDIIIGCIKAPNMSRSVKAKTWKVKSGDKVKVHVHGNYKRKKAKTIQSKINSLKNGEDLFVNYYRRRQVKDALHLDLGGTKGFDVTPRLPWMNREFFLEFFNRHPLFKDSEWVKDETWIDDIANNSDRIEESVRSELQDENGNIDLVKLDERLSKGGVPIVVGSKLVGQGNEKKEIIYTNQASHIMVKQGSGSFATEWAVAYMEANGVEVGVYDGGHRNEEIVRSEVYVANLTPNLADKKQKSADVTDLMNTIKTIVFKFSDETLSIKPKFGLPYRKSKPLKPPVIQHTGGDGTTTVISHDRRGLRTKELVLSSSGMEQGKYGEIDLKTVDESAISFASKRMKKVNRAIENARASSLSDLAGQTLSPEEVLSSLGDDDDEEE